VEYTDSKAAKLVTQLRGNLVLGTGLVNCFARSVAKADIDRVVYRMMGLRNMRSHL
jgi:hypothetical protein